MSTASNLTILNHGLAYDQLYIMRNQDSTPAQFRQAASKLTEFVVYEALRNAPTTTKSVTTPMTQADVPVSAEPNPVVCGILRAGQIMIDAALLVAPQAQVGHIGLYRDEETHTPEYYYENLTDLAGRTVLLVDPMLATGGSGIYAVDKLLSYGADAANITMCCLIASQEGVEKFSKHVPQAHIVAAAVDEKLNEDAYIVPGLGDAGDRINNTPG